MDGIPPTKIFLVLKSLSCEDPFGIVLLISTYTNLTQKSQNLKHVLNLNSIPSYYISTSHQSLNRFQINQSGYIYNVNL